MKEMGTKKTINYELDSREIFINKFIEKFPKAKLHTLTQINKYYNKKNTNSININKDFLTNSIYDYLSILN